MTSTEIKLLSPDPSPRIITASDTNDVYVIPAQISGAFSYVLPPKYKSKVNTTNGNETLTVWEKEPPAAIEYVSVEGYVTAKRTSSTPAKACWKIYGVLVKDTTEALQIHEITLIDEIGIDGPSIILNGSNIPTITVKGNNQNISWTSNVTISHL